MNIAQIRFQLGPASANRLLDGRGLDGAAVFVIGLSPEVVAGQFQEQVFEAGAVDAEVDQ